MMRSPRFYEPPRRILVFNIFSNFDDDGNDSDDDGKSNDDENCKLQCGKEHKSNLDTF